MKKTKSISIRLSEKTYNRLNSIREQLIEKGLNDDLLTDSYIIREAIITFDQKLRYLIYDKEYVNKQNQKVK